MLKKINMVCKNDLKMWIVEVTEKQKSHSIQILQSCFICSYNLIVQSYNSYPERNSHRSTKAYVPIAKISFRGQWPVNQWLKVHTTASSQTLIRQSVTVSVFIFIHYSLLIRFAFHKKWTHKSCSATSLFAELFLVRKSTISRFDFSNYLAVNKTRVFSNIDLVSEKICHSDRVPRLRIRKDLRI